MSYSKRADQRLRREHAIRRVLGAIRYNGRDVGILDSRGGYGGALMRWANKKQNNTLKRERERDGWPMVQSKKTRQGPLLLRKWMTLPIYAQKSPSSLSLSISLLMQSSVCTSNKIDRSARRCGPNDSHSVKVTRERGGG